MKYYKYKIGTGKDAYYGMFSVNDNVDVKKVEEQIGTKCVEIKEYELA